MKKLLLLITLVAAMGLYGCGTKDVSDTDSNKASGQTAKTETDFIIEDDEDVEETSDDLQEKSDDTDVVNEEEINATEESEEVLVVDESILDEPIPATLDETVKIMKAIPNGQLLSDFMFKVMEELDTVEYSDIEWTSELGAYIDSLATENPTLLQEFYAAEVY